MVSTSPSRTVTLWPTDVEISTSAAVAPWALARSSANAARSRNELDGLSAMAGLTGSLTERGSGGGKNWGLARTPCPNAQGQAAPREKKTIAYTQQKKSITKNPQKSD